LRGQGYSSINEAYRCHNLFFVDELLSNLHPALILSLIVAFYRQEWTPLARRLFIDLFNG
jgi:hypothetical protein